MNIFFYYMQSVLDQNSKTSYTFILLESLIFPFFSEEVTISINKPYTWCTLFLLAFLTSHVQQSAQPNFYTSLPLIPALGLPGSCLNHYHLLILISLLISLLSGIAPSSGDKCAHKLSSRRASHTPIAAVTDTPRDIPKWEKLEGKNPTLAPSPQKAYLFSKSLDQLPTFGRIRKHTGTAWVRANRNGSFTLPYFLWDKLHCVTKL